MDKDELEITKHMKTLMIDADSDDDLILDSIEQFEEKLEYLDMTDDKKEKIRKMCKDIKEEENEATRESLFKLLQKEIN